MRQLGMLNGSNLFGDLVPEKHLDQYKARDGALNSRSQKAISWYMEQNDLALEAIGSYPQIAFRTSDGEVQSVFIEEISNDYQARDRRIGA
jgi:hypothetical protein